MINKLRRKFIIIAMVSVTLVIVLLCASINVINFVSTNSDLSDMLKLISENRGMMPEIPREGMPKGMLEAPVTLETPYATRYFVLFYDEDGELLRADLRHIAAVTEDDAGDYLSVAVKHGDGFGYVGSYKYYVVSEGSSYMAIFLDCQQELHSVRVFALVSMLVAAVGIILIYLLVLFFSKRAIDPVVKSAERQKQFITDASHELKTPLTVITTSLKVLEMEIGQQKWIDKIQLQTDRLRDLVNELVALSRFDEEKPTLRISNFAISDAVSETAESFMDYAEAQGRTMELNIAPGLTYRGDEYAVRQLVSVLLDNAVKYSNEGGIIRFTLEQGRRSVVIRSYNTCAPIDPAELDKLFDRFYRVEKSRSKQTGGFGVGLSIARSIAEAHKGSITAQCPDENSIQFTVILK